MVVSEAADTWAPCPEPLPKEVCATVAKTPARRQDGEPTGCAGNTQTIQPSASGAFGCPPAGRRFRGAVVHDILLFPNMFPVGGKRGGRRGTAAGGRWTLPISPGGPVGCGHGPSEIP